MATVTATQLLDFQIERTRDEMKRQAANLTEEVALVAGRLANGSHPVSMPRLSTLAVEVDVLRVKLMTLMDTRDELAKIAAQGAA